MKAYARLVLCLLFAAPVLHAEAGSGASSAEAYTFRPINTLVELQILQREETFLIQQDCRSRIPDIYNREQARRGPTLEFGLNIPLPQALPATSQWYTGYTCARPFHE